MMRKFYLLFFIVFTFYNLKGQVSITNVSPSVLIDFSNSTPSTVGTNPVSSYNASGFEPNPVTAGRLNSNAWAVTGWSNGDLSFGGNQITATTDYTRGSTAIAVTTGGFYAFTGAPASAIDPTFMIQPGGSDFAPGNLTLRIQNNGTDPITQLNVNYNLYIRNDQGRSNSFNFSYSTNDVSYTSIPALDYTSPAAADALGWVLVGSAPSRSTIITGLNIAPGAFLYLRWSGADAGGTGARDEFGLDDINVTATFTPQSTDYYRSVSSGNWSNASSWETSSDNSTWVPAVLPPTSSAKTITIRNGYTISISTSASADEIIIETGGILVHINGQTFILDNGTGTDMVVNGTYELNGTQPSGSGTIEIMSGGLVKVNSNPAPNQSDDFAFGNANVTFYTGSTYEWASVNTPSWSNRVYFTPGQITTFRFTASPSGILGGGTINTTVIHGVLQADADITIHNSADKTFVNGITGVGNIYADLSFTGDIKITGVTAVLGGSGLLTLPVGPSSLRIGSGTVVSMLSNKSIKGDITLLPNSYINLGIYNLTDTGSISGGITNYIKTNSTGSLILGNVNGLINAPIGNSTYNPLTITNPSGYDWSVRVEDALQVNDPFYIPNQPKAVQREWHITPSVNPPLTGTDIVFRYDDTDPSQVNIAQFNTTETIQVWHEVASAMPWGFDWIAAGPAQNAVVVSGGKTATITNWTRFSPFAISTFSAPLPIKLISFNAIKVNNSLATLNWELAACCSAAAKFEVEKSADGRNFNLLTTVPGSATNRFYLLNDAKLEKGATYYRLKMTDADGKISFSKVVALINDIKGLLITAVIPNPVQDNASVLINTARSGAVAFEITNLSGAVVKRWTASVAAGTNTISFPAAELPAGVYLLQAKDKDTRTFYRFIKQ